MPSVEAVLAHAEAGDCYTRRLYTFEDWTPPRLGRGSHNLGVKSISDERFVC